MFHPPLPAGIPTSQPFRPGAHYGIDYAAPMGTPIYAADAGWARYVANEPGGYGLTVTLEHADGWESRYAHLSSFAVTQGQAVTRGQVIGWTGNTGYSTGPHLHYELRQYGTPVDPAPLLGGASSNGEAFTMGQMETLGQWEQDTRAVILGTQGQWEQDTRTVLIRYMEAKFAALELALRNSGTLTAEVAHIDPAAYGAPTDAPVDQVIILGTDDTVPGEEDTGDRWR